jgi:ubiquinone biosynthesis protein COQ4
MNAPTITRRYPLRAFVAGARWLANPVSEGGAKQVPRIQLYTTGPEMLAEVQQMRAHPTGRRILADRPDLAATLSTSSALASHPPGSLGRALHDAMSVPGGIPGYMLAGLIYRDGFFDSYDMPDDVRYAIERTRCLHDLFHVLTGYGTDLAGEGMLIYFQNAYRQAIGFTRAAISAQGLGPLLFLRPRVGQQRWRTLLREAYARGTAARERLSPMFVYWEELLPRPLDDVREELGITPFDEDTSDWLANTWLGRSAAKGFGAYAREAERAQLARRIVEAGVDFRGLMRASPERQAGLRRLVAEGADDAAIQAAAEGLCGDAPARRALPAGNGM